MDIHSKSIVITGASGGIGFALAKVLAREGARLVLAARSKAKLETLAKELPDAIAVPADMRKPKDIQKLIDAAVEKYGRIDVLVNNAGQGMYGPIEKIDIEKYKEVMELNVYGALRAMEAAIPVMRAQGGGMILNVSSRVSKNYFPYLGAYASTKYALNAITLTARQELEKDRIVVSVFHPKMTATDFGRNAVGARPSFAGRPGGAPAVDTPEEVAEKIADLIRSEAPEAEM
ncbi:MAG TPA: SDR family NAD(P)-dependent oxidoreductase [Candidatus Paceibacterota bacterium]|nr:SDR family NAD(P)-dependent oxidoreductase [Candidatus Paceibacterota bacterium]